MGHTLIQLGPEVEEAAKKIVAYAKDPKNWYRIDSDGKPISELPGDKPEHTLKTGSTRAVFSYTMVKGAGKSGGLLGDDRLMRFLTVSNITNYPSPISTFTLARMFGFTGAEADDHGVVKEPAKEWGLAVNKEEGAAIVQQILKCSCKDADPDCQIHPFERYESTNY